MFQLNAHRSKSSKYKEISTQTGARLFTSRATGRLLIGNGSLECQNHQFRGSAQLSVDHTHIRIVDCKYRTCLTLTTVAVCLFHSRSGRKNPSQHTSRYRMISQYNLLETSFNQAFVDLDWKGVLGGGWGSTQIQLDWQCACSSDHHGLLCWPKHCQEH